ncbi:MAG: chemotaxis protein CheW [Magnetospirillum sp. WYHS-4]
MNQVVPVTGDRSVAVFHEEKETLVTLYVGGQLFGMPVLRVRDIIMPERIFPVPLAPREVAGSINLRGRIVTVIDMRSRLGLPPKEKKEGAQTYCVTVDHGGELYGLLVDRIGDVMDLSRDLYEENSSTLGAHWREYSLGVFRLSKELLVKLDIDRFLDLNG